MAEKKYRVGIDLGGTNIKAGIVDGDNKLLATASRPTKSERRGKKLWQIWRRLLRMRLSKPV